MPKLKNEPPSREQNNLITKLINYLKKLTGIERPNSKIPNKLIDILNHNQKIDSIANLILNNCVKFIDKTVEDIIIPRSDIFGIKIDSTTEEINKTLVEGSPTRIIVYQENFDNIIGFVHIKDLYKSFLQGSNYKLINLIRKPITVALSTKLTFLLSKMQQERIHLAVVVDEYGGSAGIVTNENILEALVGEIHDEHDKQIQDEYQIVNETTLITNSRVKVEKIEEIMQIDLNNAKYDCDTIGGLVIFKAGKVPPVGSTLIIAKNIQAEILEANKRLLKKIKIKIIKESST
jgi:CBS domain containing-hemolysin-like protein